jgi:hypothetical protein
VPPLPPGAGEPAGPVTGGGMVEPTPAVALGAAIPAAPDGAAPAVEVPVGGLIPPDGEVAVMPAAPTGV